MKSALIRVLWKPGREGRARRSCHERGRFGTAVSGRRTVGLGRKARSESPSPGGQGDSKSHDTRASLTHYQRVWGTSRFDAESLLEKQLMECLKCALLEWGPSSGPSLASRNGCPREYHYPTGRQAPVETVPEFMAAVPDQIGRTVRCVCYCPPSIT